MLAGSCAVKLFTPLIYGFYYCKLVFLSLSNIYMYPKLDPTSKIIRPRLCSQILGLDGTVFTPTNLVKAKITVVKSFAEQAGEVEWSCC